MSKYLIFVLGIVLLLSCKKEEEPTPVVVEPVYSEPAIPLGIWEATFEVSKEGDTTTYAAKTNNLCAQTVLDYDHTSGFQLLDTMRADIYWCDTKMHEYFIWYYENDKFGMDYKGKYTEFDVQNFTESSFTLVNNSGVSFYMKKR